ncbi:MAG: LacI family DNA-binding transcriptional regulator [Glaciecola sp.]|jgi:LacI family transcriptional regulator
MATIYQVADLAGVSLATVSRVMNGNVKVSDKSRAKVQSAMKELGYQPNIIAQSLASNRTNRVGVLVSELSGPFFSYMLAVVESALREEGKHAIITAGHSDVAKEQEGIEFLFGCRCDALILHIDAVSDEYLLKLKERKVPFSLINHRIDDIADCCFTVDNEQGGYLAAKAVIDMGHTKIAYISGPEFKEDARMRLEGHKRALEEAGLTFNEALHYRGNYNEDGGKAGFDELSEQRFSALICANDEMATGAMYSARKHGLDLPHDLSIVGYDDQVFARYTYPTLTTIKNPIAEMGSMAAKWVLKEVYNINTSETIHNTFEPKLIIRNSIEENI